MFRSDIQIHLIVVVVAKIAREKKISLDLCLFRQFEFMEAKRTAEIKKKSRTKLTHLPLLVNS